MRILLVNSERGFRGGEFQTAALAEGLSGRGIEVHVAAACRSPLAREIEGSVPVHGFAFETLPLWTPIGLRGLIRRSEIDLVHAQTSRAHTHAWMAARSLRDAPPLVVSRRVAFETSGGVLGRRKYLSGVAHYIPISEAAAGSLRSIGVPDERITIVPSGVKLETFLDARGDESLLERWGLAGGGNIVGVVAALEREKGLDFLVRAAGVVLDKHEDCAFVIMGEGSERGRLKDLIGRSGLGGRVVVAEPVKELERVLPLFTVYALPSLQEGMSTSLVAAMVAGRPVVATRAGGIPEVTGEEGAVLVPPGDAGALAGALNRLLEDPGLRGRVAGRGKARAMAFDIERTIDATVGIYRSLVEGR